MYIYEYKYKCIHNIYLLKRERVRDRNRQRERYLKQKK